MAKHRRTDQEAVVDLDQVLLELFAGQLLLDPAAAKLPGAPAVRPVAASAKGKPRNHPPAAKPRKG